MSPLWLRIDRAVAMITGAGIALGCIAIAEGLGWL